MCKNDGVGFPQGMVKELKLKQRSVNFSKVFLESTKYRNTGIFQLSMGQEYFLQNTGQNIFC